MATGKLGVKQLEASLEVVTIHILNTLFCVKNIDSVNSVQLPQNNKTKEWLE